MSSVYKQLAKEKDKDPQGTKPIMIRAIKDGARRLTTIQANVKREVRRILGESLVTNREYLYVVDDAKLRAFDLFLDEQLKLYVDGDNFYAARWFDKYLDQSVRISTEKTINEVVPQINDLPATEQDLKNEYRLELDRMRLFFDADTQAGRASRLLYSRTFNEMAGFAGDMKKDLSRILANTILNGVNANDAAREIDERFGWLKTAKRDGKGYQSRGQRIARTEIGAAYKQAKSDNTRKLNEVGTTKSYEFRLIHLSALAENTRKWHGDRHGKIYTPKESAAFFAVDGNAINCQCSTENILVNTKTGEPVSKRLLKGLAKQREAFERSA